MYGINLDKPIKYKSSSFRYFDENEYHTNRYCFQDVLLMVYDGVLRFSEDGIEKSVYPGQYYIQKSLMEQRGNRVSDKPKYLYVHFWAEWTDKGMYLPMSGSFNYSYMKPFMEDMNNTNLGEYTYIEKAGAFYRLISELYRHVRKESKADKIASFINQNFASIRCLEDICSHFYYSKNYLIEVFKKEYGITPFEYLNKTKIKYATHLIKSTSESVSVIANQCGFRDYSHFYRMFVRFNGVNPERIRSIGDI